MDNLPPPLILEILQRLSSSSDLAHCRLTCKTLNSLTDEVTSITLLCPFHHYTKARSSSTTISFKNIVNRFIEKLRFLSSISIGVDELLQSVSYDDVEDDYDDLYLTDVDFVADWLPCVAKGLKMLSFVDFWVQSCWRRSCVLSLISQHCKGLNELEIKNAWLSVDGVSVMSTLTSLTLEYVRLDDENLSKLNDCFPCLETLNLIGVGGLIDPKINLRHLKSCRWSVSNFPRSLSVIAPNLVELKLKCVRPSTLVLETPLLSDFQLTLEKVCTFDMGVFPYLKKLQLESRLIHDLISVFQCSKSVTELSLNSINKSEMVKAENYSLNLLFDIFPNMNSLNLGSGAYAEMEASFGAREFEGKIGMKSLRNFTAQLVIRDIDSTVSFISFILEKCKNLSTMSLLIHNELEPLISNNLISKCVTLCPRVQWKWGFWKEGNKDVWVSDGV